MLAAQTLAHIGVPVERAMEQVRELRAERYVSLRAFYRGESDRLQRLAHEKLTFVVDGGCYAVGRSLVELDLAALGVAVGALRRHGVRCEGVVPETRLQAEDILVLVGTPAALALAERLLLDGRR